MEALAEAGDLTLIKEQIAYHLERTTAVASEIPTRMPLGLYDVNCVQVCPRPSSPLLAPLALACEPVRSLFLSSRPPPLPSAAKTTASLSRFMSVEQNLAGMLLNISVYIQSMFSVKVSLY